jgi:prevent-host-death family protein
MEEPMAREKNLSFVEARARLSRILDQVSRGGKPVIVGKREKPIAVIVGIDRYRGMVSAGKNLRRLNGRRILKLRATASAVGDIDQAISSLRRSRIETLLGSL